MLCGSAHVVQKILRNSLQTRGILWVWVGLLGVGRMSDERAGCGDSAAGVGA